MKKLVIKNARVMVEGKWKKVDVEAHSTNSGMKYSYLNDKGQVKTATAGNFSLKGKRLPVTASLDIMYCEIHSQYFRKGRRCPACP